MTVEINSLARSSASTRIQDLRAVLIRYADVWWMIALALLAAAYSLQYDILRQPIPHDTTFHIYAAQQMLEGHAIYRDVAIIKAPLADFVSAFAIFIARVIGISDIMGTRLMSLTIVMATASATYWAGRVLFHSRAVGVLAGIVMASWNFYGLRALTGPEPKAFVILFALLALTFLAQKHWGWAGACAALSALAWQPALMVQAIVMLFALLAPFIETTRARQDNVRAAFRNNLRALFGFCAPFALVILYLGVNNALLAALNATIGANVTHFNNTQARVPLFQTVDENLAEIIEDGALYCYSYNEYWLNGAGALGFFGIFAAQIFSALRTKRLPINLQHTPLLLYAFGFAAFSLIDFDYCPDLIPLMPVVALGVGWLGFVATRSLARFVSRFLTPFQPRTLTNILLSLVAVLLIAVYWFDVRGYRITGTLFLDQLQVAQTAQRYLQPGDRVLSFGNAIILVELHLPNATKILHLGSKSGLGVLASEPGGMQGMLDALDQNPPKVISLARETRPEWTQPFYEWLERRYEPAEVFGRANMRLFVLKP